MNTGESKDRGPPSLISSFKGIKKKKKKIQRCLDKKITGISANDFLRHGRGKDAYQERGGRMGRPLGSLEDPTTESPFLPEQTDKHLNRLG